MSQFQYYDTSLNSLTLEGDDYTATSVVLTFMSGDMDGARQSVNIPIINDNLVERPEVFDVRLLVPGTTTPTLTGTIVIIDDDSKFKDDYIIHIVNHICCKHNHLVHYVILSECECVCIIFD